MCCSSPLSLASNRHSVAMNRIKTDRTSIARKIIIIKLWTGLVCEPERSGIKVCNQS